MLTIYFHGDKKQNEQMTTAIEGNVVILPLLIEKWIQLLPLRFVQKFADF